MPNYICKFTDPATNQDYYLEWSTVVDAPVTWGMTKEEFERYYLEEYGRDGQAGLEKRMVRVEAKGTSSHLDTSVEDLIRHNHAGKNEKELTYAQILNDFCINPHSDDDAPPDR